MNLCGKSATYIPSSDCECYEMARELLLDVLSDYMTRDEIEEALALKQDVLTAGNRITISNNVISSADVSREDVENALEYEEIDIGYKDRSGNTVRANVLGNIETETVFNTANDTGVSITVYPSNADGSNVGEAVTVYTSTTFLRFANNMWDHLVGMDANGDYVDLNDSGVQFCANYTGSCSNPVVSNFSSSTNTYSFISG